MIHGTTRTCGRRILFQGIAFALTMGMMAAPAVAWADAGEPEEAAATADEGCQQSEGAAVVAPAACEAAATSPVEASTPCVSQPAAAPAPVVEVAQPVASTPIETPAESSVATDEPVTAPDAGATTDVVDDVAAPGANAEAQSAPEAGSTDVVDETANSGNGSASNDDDESGTTTGTTDDALKASGDGSSFIEGESVVGDSNSVNTEGDAMQGESLGAAAEGAEGAEGATIILDVGYDTEDDEDLEGDQLQSAAGSNAVQVRIPTGIFVLESSHSYCMVADVAGGKTANKTNVRIWTSNFSKSQQWRLEYCNGGYYIVSVNSNKVLDVAGGKAVRGTNVWLYSKNGSKAQLWIPKQQANGGWVFYSMLGNNLVLAIKGGKAVKDANLYVWTVNGLKGQTFWVREQNPPLGSHDRTIEDGTYYLTVKKSTSMALDVAGDSKTKGANIQIAKLDKGAGQRFMAIYSNGYYTFTNIVSGLALDVAKGSTIAKANIQLWTANHTSAQQWIVRDLGNGYYELVNRGTGLVLEIAGGNTAAKTNVWGYYSNATASQSWKLTRASTFANGFYTFTDTSSGYVFDITGGSTSSGAALQRHKGNSTMAQKFYLAETGTIDTYEIWSINSGLRLNTKNGAVVQSTTTGTTSKWKLVKSGSYYVLKNASSVLGFNSSNKAIVKSSGGSTFKIQQVDALQVGGYFQLQNLAGTVVDIKNKSTKKELAVSAKADGSTTQIWKISKDEKGFILTNVASGRVLGLVAPDQADVRQATNHDLFKQRWRVRFDTTYGGLVLVNANSKKVLDISGGSKAVGKTVQARDEQASKTQAWRLASVNLTLSSTGGSGSTTIPVAEKIAQIAEHYANHNEAHGYDYGNHLGRGKEVITLKYDGVSTTVAIDNGDVDCSGLVYYCVKAALPTGQTISDFATSTELSVLTGSGYFTAMAYNYSSVRRGDILLKDGHTAIALGNGLQAEANINEYGTIYGGTPGDQGPLSVYYCDEVVIDNLSYWQWIIRYTG